MSGKEGWNTAGGGSSETETERSPGEREEKEAAQVPAGRANGRCGSRSRARTQRRPVSSPPETGIIGSGRRPSCSKDPDSGNGARAE